MVNHNRNTNQLKPIIMKNEIKKLLYKEKPTAYLAGISHTHHIYTCDLQDKTIVRFEIPIEEADFEKEVPAQLLIRWMV